MPEYRLTMTNDARGVQNLKHKIQYGQAGNHTAVTAHPVFVADEPCVVTAVHLSSATYPTTTDRTLTATLKKITGTTAAADVCSTNPAFGATADTAANGGMVSTFTGGTGVTSAVIKTDGTQILAKGDMLTLDLAIAGANGTIGTGAHVYVEVSPYVA